MGFLRNLFGKNQPTVAPKSSEPSKGPKQSTSTKSDAESKTGDFVKIFMDQAKKMVEETDTKYLGPGGFGSIKEIEIAYFIALIVDMTTLNDQEITNLVVRNYGLDDTKTRQMIKDTRYSRKKHGK